ncbi:hypothetical protein OIO90_000357 [Microbotryomycetes sp. JL221]|nr:hypothetical protein OIO90_000357 [Microbotryomycetes sp. JL221]
MHRASAFAPTAATAPSYIITSKRSRSTSPDPLAKRRVPLDYVPAMYANQRAEAPPAVARSLSEDVTSTLNSTSVNNAGMTLRSQRHTPVNDQFVSRTEALHLSTPSPRDGQSPFTFSTVQAQPRQSAHDDDAQMDAMDDSNELNVATHQGLAELRQHHNTSHTPHDAPPLHLNLAGSPQAMSRSSSSSSSAATITFDSRSSALYDDSAFVTRQQHLHPSSSLHGRSLHQRTADTSMSTDTSSPPRAKQGWKVTFGYRSDCQKCIDRIPGHYSHVVMEGQGMQQTNGDTHMQP